MLHSPFYLGLPCSSCPPSPATYVCLACRVYSVCLQSGSGRRVGAAAGAERTSRESQCVLGAPRSGRHCSLLGHQRTQSFCRWLGWQGDLSPCRILQTGQGSDRWKCAVFCMLVFYNLRTWTNQINLIQSNSQSTWLSKTFKCADCWAN